MPVPIPCERSGASGKIGEQKRGLRARFEQGVQRRESQALGADGFSRHCPEDPADLTASCRFGTLDRTHTELEKQMAKLALVYGLRLLPEEDLAEVREATVVLKNGKTARVAMHLIEGTKEEIESTFHESIQAFFELYPEI